MNPVLPSPSAVRPADGNAQNGSRPQTSFSSFMEKHLATERGKNLLAVKPASAPKEKIPAQGPEGEELSLAGLLAKFLRELQVAAEKVETGPGEWIFMPAESEVLQKIAEEAGLDENAISLLLQKFENEQGEVELSDFLAMFAEHFEEIAKNDPVMGIETDLPLLESFLLKMGLPVELVAEISAQAVNGDGKFDLGIFLAGLLEVKEQTTQITLTDLEVEQFEEMLARAGVPKELQEVMVAARDSGTVELSLARLCEMLGQGVAKVKADRMPAEIPAFLSDLANILEEAGFTNKEVGWTPVVQESVDLVYRELMSTVDLSSVKIKVADKGITAPVSLEPEAEMAEDGGEFWEVPAEDLAEVDAKRVSLLEGKDNAIKGKGMLLNEQPTVTEQGFGVTAATNRAEGADAVAAKNPLPTGNNAPTPQQTIFDQISQGLMRGLKDNEHHLIIKLYPPELGEVKIDLLVKNDQVAVSFAAENSKVKETLEANMKQFREDMGQRGFNLGECMVSVGQQDQSGDAWQRFEKAWDDQRHNIRVVVDSLADLPKEALYNRLAAGKSHEDGISILV